VLGGIAHQRIDGLDHLGKKLLVGNAPAAFGVAGRLAVLVVDVNQVNVAGHIEFTRAQLAHANDAQLAQLALRGAWGAMLLLQRGIAVLVGLVQCQFGQFGHHAGHFAQRGLFVAVQVQQALHGQLPGDAQGCAGVESLGQQGLQQGLQLRALQRAVVAEVQQVGITAADTLAKARTLGARWLLIAGHNS
jgi:hypothetical protein